MSVVMNRHLDISCQGGALPVWQITFRALSIQVSKKQAMTANLSIYEIKNLVADQQGQILEPAVPGQSLIFFPPDCLSESFWMSLVDKIPSLSLAN